MLIYQGVDGSTDLDVLEGRDSWYRPGPDIVRNDTYQPAVTESPAYTPEGVVIFGEAPYWGEGDPVSYPADDVGTRPDTEAAEYPPVPGSNLPQGWSPLVPASLPIPPAPAPAPYQVPAVLPVAHDAEVPDVPFEGPPERVNPVTATWRPVDAVSYVSPITLYPTPQLSSGAPLGQSLIQAPEPMGAKLPAISPLLVVGVVAAIAGAIYFSRG